MTQSRQGRSSFNSVAKLYDSARPTYPAALFDDIITLSRIPPNGRILEVGCGSGQATLPLARRGYRIDCIELGDQLAQIAADKLAAYPNATVICADFETIPLPHAHYDLLTSATAFHWIASEIGFRKSRDHLKPGGSIALFWNRPALTKASRHYMAPLQKVYEQIAPELTRYYRPPPHPDDVTTEYAETIPASGYFREAQIRKRYFAVEYSADSYVDLLATFSDHLLLEPQRRERLFAGIRDLINSQFSGSIIREHVALLYLARRK